MTQKLYELDAYQMQFEATVLSCEPCKSGYALVLDQTAFFPEGGGQPADEGWLWDDPLMPSEETVAVADVQINGDGIITHTVARSFEKGMTVYGKVNRPVRFFRMQNHTAEHLLSGLIHKTYGYDNVGFHLNDDYVTLDVSGPLSEGELWALEEAANMAVYANRAVVATYPTPDELVTLDYRSKLDLTEGVRLITIEGYDVCACCAPHVKTTGEIGLIKILDAIPYKGGTRITMLSGMPALKDYVALHGSQREIMRMLSAPRDKTVEFVGRLQESVTALRAENARLAAELVNARLEIVPLDGITCGFTSGASFDALRTCAEEHGNPDCLTAMFSVEADGTASYFLRFENGDVRDTVKALNTAFAGKGGGKPQYAQGKITATKEEIAKFFE